MDDEAIELLPSEFNTSTQGHGLEVSKDKLMCTYVGDARHSNDVGSLQSNRPVPCHRLVYYFELFVVDQGEMSNIAIGFSDKRFKLTRQPGYADCAVLKKTLVGGHNEGLPCTLLVESRWDGIWLLHIAGPPHPNCRSARNPLTLPTYPPPNSPPQQVGSPTALGTRVKTGASTTTRTPGKGRSMGRPSGRAILWGLASTWPSKRCSSRG